MPNIASVLKTEITRVARKEVRAEIDGLKKASAQHRSQLVGLRRQVEMLEKQLRRLSTRTARGDASVSAKSADELVGPQRRFSATRLGNHREKTGLSAASYGALLRLSGQTIYNWEQGKGRPNPAQVRELAVLKGLNKRALADRLEAQPSAPA